MIGGYLVFVIDQACGEGYDDGYRKGIHDVLRAVRNIGVNGPVLRRVTMILDHGVHAAQRGKE